jgi:hypothetical protein
VSRFTGPVEEFQRDLLDELVEDLQQSVCGLAVDGGVSIAKRYAEGRLELHVHLKLSARRFYEKATNLCALFFVEKAAEAELGTTDRVPLGAA